VTKPLLPNCRVEPEFRAQVDQAATDCELTPSDWLREVVAASLDLHFGRAVEVDSETQPGEVHTVTINEAGDAVHCSCPGFTHRGTCKHVEVEEVELGAAEYDELVQAGVDAQRGPQPSATVIVPNEPAAKVSERDCIHPLTRRLGNRCGVCGGTVTGGRRRGR